MADDITKDPLLNARIEVIEAEKKYAEAVHLLNVFAVMVSVAAGVLVLIVALRVEEGSLSRGALTPISLGLLLLLAWPFVDIARWSKKLTARRIDVATLERAEELALRVARDRPEPRKRCRLFR